MSGNGFKLTMVWNENPEAPPVPNLSLSEMDRTSPVFPGRKVCPWPAAQCTAAALGT